MVSLLGVVGALVMGLVTYWMYSDSEKATKLKEEKKQEIKQSQSDDRQGILRTTKITNPFKEWMDNPLQGKGVQKPKVNVVDGNSTTSIPDSGASHQQPKESFYQDAK